MRSLVLVMLAACGGHGQSPGMGDGGPSDGGPLGDASPCANGDVFLGGELVDWDSPDPTFLGVFMAKLSVSGLPGTILSTPPNGRLDVCVPQADPLRLDVDGPDDYLDGFMVVARDALQSLHPISMRDITMTRALSFYTEQGLVFDPNKAHVLVFLAGDRSTITLDRAHGAPQAGNDDALPDTFVWTAGDSGRYVLFPNVDVTQPTGTIRDPLASHVVPLVAGKLTMVAVSFIFI